MAELDLSPNDRSADLSFFLFFFGVVGTTGGAGVSRGWGGMGHQEEMHLRTGCLAALVWGSSLR